MIAACNHKFSAYFTILVTMKIEDQTEHHISETGTNFHSDVLGCSSPGAMKQIEHNKTNKNKYSPNLIVWTAKC